MARNDELFQLTSIAQTAQLLDNFTDELRLFASYYDLCAKPVRDLGEDIQTQNPALKSLQVMDHSAIANAITLTANLHGRLESYHGLAELHCLAITKTASHQNRVQREKTAYQIEKDFIDHIKPTVDRFIGVVCDSMGYFLYGGDETKPPAQLLGVRDTLESLGIPPVFRLPESVLSATEIYAQKLFQLEDIAPPKRTPATPRALLGGGLASYNLSTTQELSVTGLALVQLLHLQQDLQDISTQFRDGGSEMVPG